MTRSLSNIFVHLLQVLYVKDARCDDFLKHIDKIKAFMDHHVFLNTHENRRCCHDFTPQFATLVRTLDHRFGDDANDVIVYGIRNNMFDG